MGITLLQSAEAELKLVDLWYAEQDPEAMDWGLMLDMVKEGFTNCDNDCDSRRVCGDDACFCIRNTFSHPEYWEAYLALRKVYLETVLTGIIPLPVR